jgi:hypothetical protein
MTLYAPNCYAGKFSFLVTTYMRQLIGARDLISYMYSVLLWCADACFTVRRVPIQRGEDGEAGRCDPHIDVSQRVAGLQDVVYGKCSLCLLPLCSAMIRRRRTC